MNETAQVLWNMFDNETQQALRHEEQRVQVTNLIIAMDVGIIGLVSLDKAINKSDLPLILIILALGLFGTLFTAKHYERFALHTRRASYYRKALESIIPERKLKELKDKADTETRKSYRVLNRIRLHYLWYGLNIFILGLGITLFIYIMIT